MSKKSEFEKKLALLRKMKEQLRMANVQAARRRYSIPPVENPPVGERKK